MWGSQSGHSLVEGASASLKPGASLGTLGVVVLGGIIAKAISG